MGEVRADPAGSSADLPNLRPNLRAAACRRLATVLVPALILAAVWQLTPLKQLLNPEHVLTSLQSVRDTWWGVVTVILASALALKLMVPLTLVALAMGSLYAFPNNVLVALTTTMLAAAGIYAVGRRAGHGVVDRMLPDELRVQIEGLGAKGVMGLAALRWVPVAHFGLTSMALGALGVPFSRFMLSTVIGQTPIVVLLVLLSDRIKAGIVDPNLQTVGVVFSVMVSIALVAVATRWFARWRKSKQVA